MTKIITTIIALLILIACGNQNKQDHFDVNIGKELCDNAAKGQAFTQADYAKAIKMLQYDIDIQSAALKRYADPDSATLEYLSFSASQEYAEISAITDKLSAYIYSHRNDLDDTNQQALGNVEKSAVEFAQTLNQILNVR